MGISFGGIDVFGFLEGYDFGPHLSQSDGILETIGLLIILLPLILAFAAFAVVSYIFQSKALFTIAKRRGIKNPWLAWVPVGTDWIVGSISDQYRYVVQGKIRNLRKLLLGFSIATTVLSSVSDTLENAVSFKQMMAGGVPAGSDLVYAILFIISLLVAIALLCTTVVYVVNSYIALYDIYRSCDPSRSRRNLLLSIFLGVVQPFLIHACRNKDLGMPPRKDEVREVIPEIVASEDAPVTPTEPTEE